MRPKNVKGVWAHLSNCGVRDAEWTLEPSQCCDSSGVFLPTPIAHVSNSDDGHAKVGSGASRRVRSSLGGPCHPQKTLREAGSSPHESVRSPISWSLGETSVTKIVAGRRPWGRACTRSIACSHRRRSSDRLEVAPEGAGVRIERSENSMFTCGSACRYTAARQVPRAIDGLRVEPCARRK